MRSADALQHRQIDQHLIGGPPVACGNCDGLGSRVGSFSEAAFWGTGMCPDWRVMMNKQSRANYIAMLKKLRDDHRSQLDDGVLNDLECLMTDLKKSPDDSSESAEASLLAVRALQGLAAVITLVTNVREFLK